MSRSKTTPKRHRFVNPRIYQMKLAIKLSRDRAERDFKAEKLAKKLGNTEVYYYEMDLIELKKGK